MNRAYLIAHATSNEDYLLRKGKLGEQKGCELRAEEYSNLNWHTVYRPIDSDKAEMIADFMEKAVSNGFIGYDQDSRNNLFDDISKIDFDVEILNTSTACDCSSLVYCAIYNAYKVNWIETVKTAPVTDTFPTYIETNLEGMFEKYQTEDYLTKSDFLLRGDILLKDGHIAVWI